MVVRPTMPTFVPLLGSSMMVNFCVPGKSRRGDESGNLVGRCQTPAVAAQEEQAAGSTAWVALGVPLVQVTADQHV